VCQRRCEDHIQTRDLELCVRQMHPSPRGVGRNLPCVDLRVEMPHRLPTGRQTSDSAEPPSRRVDAALSPAALKSAAARPGKTCRASPEHRGCAPSEARTARFRPVRNKPMAASSPDGVRGDFQPPGCEVSPRCRVPHRQRCSASALRDARARLRRGGRVATEEYPVTL